MKSATDKINDYKELINKSLDKFIPVKYPEEIYNSMRYSVLAGGKRLRPIIVLEVCKALGGKIENAIPTACAIEMLHSQSLIHDDLPCMDNDDFRRGKPTNHKVYGESTAVLAGDALLSFAPQLIITETSNEIADNIKLSILNEFFNGAGVNGIIAGQVVDIASEQKEPDEKTLNFIHKYKTGKLFELSFKAGALLAGADEKILAQVTELSHKIGLAFQYADDILDEISTFEELGKTPGKDANAKKMTACALYGREKTKEKLNMLLSDAYDIMKKTDLNTDVLCKLVENIINGINK